MRSSQARRLDQVDRNVGEIFKRRDGYQVSSYRTDLHWTVAGQAAQVACRQRIALEQAQQEAANAAEDAVSQQRGDGLSYRDIGE